MDYGLEIFTTVNDLRALQPKFMILPSQAIKARLSGIRPSNENWSTEAIQKFRSMVNAANSLGGLVARIDGFLQTSEVKYCSSIKKYFASIHEIAGHQSKRLPC